MFMPREKIGRVSWRVGLLPDLLRRVNAVFAGVGQTRAEGVHRLVSWFVDQPAAVQREILGIVPADDVARKSAGAAASRRAADELYDGAKADQAAQTRKRGTNKRG